MKSHKDKTMNMTDEQMRIAIAEACGAKLWNNPTNAGPKQLWAFACLSPIEVFEHAGVRRNSDCLLPDYLNDLNAMHEAEKVLIGLCKEGDFWFHLRTLLDFPDGESDWCSFYFFQAIHATARQRAEAFIKTLNLEPK